MSGKKNNNQIELEQEEEKQQETYFSSNDVFQKEAVLGDGDSKEQKQALLRPYKSIGVFTDDNPFYVHYIANKPYMVASTSNTFKVYTLPELKVQLLSPTLPNKIRAITALNEFVFIGVKNMIYKMRYYHLISQIQLQNKVVKIVVLGKFLLCLCEQGVLQIIEHNQNRVLYTIDMTNIYNNSKFNQNNGHQLQINDIIHPPTYLNKILAYGPNHLQVWNIATQQLIFSFDKLLEEFQEQKITISVVECSPVLNVVAVAFSNGYVYLVDIKQDTILFKVKCQFPSISLSFSKQDPPLLACGDEKGNITLWDLNERKKFSFMKEVHSGCVNSLNFLQNEQSLLSGSGQSNEVFQWKFEEMADQKYIINRKRTGLKANISKLRYMDKDHVLTSTNYNKTEIREFSLLNECMSQFYSTKQQSQKQMKNKHILTEGTIDQTKPIKDFSFSMNRARDWANVVTIHNESDKPCLFSSDSKSIVKKNIEIHESKQDKQSDKISEVSSVFVTNCGNFGILGFQSGKIIKFNMQSGKHQKTYQNKIYQHNNTVTCLFVNHYNKYLVSACSNSKLNIWDFFSGQIIHSHQYDNQVSILFMRPARYLDNFIVALTDCTLEIWDTQTQKIGRKFKGHTNKITDACWVDSNRQIISSGMDGKLNIYDILSNTLIQSIVMKSNKYYITSLDMHNDILITSFNNSRQLFLWHNLIDSLYWNQGETTKTIQFKSLLKFHTNSRQNFYLQDQIKNEEQDKIEGVELELNIVGENDDSLIKFTQLETGKWLPLAYIEEIKERNKLENLEKEDIKMPFFLDFDNKDKVKSELHQELKEKIQEKSKLLTDKKDQYLVELDQGLDQIFLNKNKIKLCDDSVEIIDYSNKFFKFLTNLSYTQVDYEMRRFLFGSIENITLVATIFSNLFDSSEQIDLKNVYFNNFVKISSYEILNNYELLEVFESLKNKIATQQTNIENKINYITCLSENFAQIPN